MKDVVFLSTPSARRATAQVCQHRVVIAISIHALREEGDFRTCVWLAGFLEFLSTPSARRATGRPERPSRPNRISIHALREEGDEHRRRTERGEGAFLSTPSARRATRLCLCFQGCTAISIHALREEGDHTIRCAVMSEEVISIHALREEGDPVPEEKKLEDRVFLSTPSARRATAVAVLARTVVVISIHALREEGDLIAEPKGYKFTISIHALREEGDRSCAEGFAPDGGISIHALREEGDGRWSCTAASVKLFLSTPSARRATPCRTRCSRSSSYFYPRPPRGGRRMRRTRRACATGYFYPRPPRGGRLMSMRAGMPWLLFLSTPSARRATLGATESRFPDEYFYPRPPRGGRPGTTKALMLAQQFLSTPSARRATPVFRFYVVGYPISIHALREEGDRVCFHR